MTDELSKTASIARDLIRIDTTNHGEGRAVGEAEAAAYVSRFLDSIGVASRTFESAPTRHSVIAELPGSDPTLPKLVLHGHLDVVPADASQWSVDPFGGIVQDGMLWGRGAVDMKDMVAMMLAATAELQRTGQQPRRGVVLAFFADEEDGGAFGAHWLVKHHPEIFDGAGLAISEVGGFSVTLEGKRAYLLQTAEKALLWLRLRATGTAAHGSQVMHDNAVTKLAKAVAALGDHEFPVELTDTTEALIERVAALIGADIEHLSPDEVALRTGGMSRFLRASLRTTANPTMLDAGYKHNVIPGTAEARIDVRPLPGREDEVLEIVREIVAAASPDVTVEIVTKDVGLEVPFDSDAVATMTRVLQRHDPGAPVLPYMLSGGTDNKSLSRLGITGYGFAPLKLTSDLDFAAMFHGVDERVPLDALDFGTQVLTDLLLEL